MKIMIVDDSNLLQIRLTNALRKVDDQMSISRACSSKEATDLLSQVVPDTVILDIALLYLMGAALRFFNGLKKRFRQFM